MQADIFFLNFKEKKSVPFETDFLGSYEEILLTIGGFQRSRAFHFFVWSLGNALIWTSYWNFSTNDWQVQPGIPLPHNRASDSCWRHSSSLP